MHAKKLVGLSPFELGVENLIQRALRKAQKEQYLGEDSPKCCNGCLAAAFWNNKETCCSNFRKEGGCSPLKYIWLLYTKHNKEVIYSILYNALNV